MSHRHDEPTLMAVLADPAALPAVLRGGRG
jgi:hypothetical protein